MGYVDWKQPPPGLVNVVIVRRGRGGPYRVSLYGPGGGVIRVQPSNAHIGEARLTVPVHKWVRRHDRAEILEV